MARWLGFVLAVALWAAPAHGARKALAIGGDARAAVEKLAALGFDVTSLEKGALPAGVAAYVKSLQAGDESVVIHSGPAGQERGENVLFAPAGSGAPLAVDRLLAQLEEKKLSVSIVVIDARPAPQGRGAKGPSQPLRAVAIGAGTVVALAAQPGRMPEEPGRGRPTVFANALAEHLEDAVEIRQMLQAVADMVASRTDHAQRPWTTARLARPYTLVASAAATVARAAVEPRPGRCSGEEEKRLDAAERRLLDARRRIDDLNALIADVPEQIERDIVEDEKVVGKQRVPNPRYQSLQRRLTAARQAKAHAYGAFEKIKLRCD